FRNLDAVLAEAGASFRDVVKLTYFVCDIDQIGAIREARNEFIDVDNPPASSLVEVARLFMPGILIEIEAVAVAPQWVGARLAHRRVSARLSRRCRRRPSWHARFRVGDQADRTP